MSRDFFGRRGAEKVESNGDFGSLLDSSRPTRCPTHAASRRLFTRPTPDGAPGMSTRPIAISRVLRAYSDGPTDGPTEGPTKRLIESRALEKKLLLKIYFTALKIFAAENAY